VETRGPEWEWQQQEKRRIEKDIDSILESIEAAFCQSRGGLETVAAESQESDAESSWSDASVEA
jgi:hypothetical protein